MLTGYRASLTWTLRNPGLIIIVLAATIGLNVYLYMVVPKGFFPRQDTGRLAGFIRGDQSISFQAMRQKLVDFVEIVMSDPAVENVVAFTGGGQRNAGSMFIALKPLAERPSRRARHRPPAGQAREGARRDADPEPGAGHPDRRAAERMPPTSSRCSPTI